MEIFHGSPPRDQFPESEVIMAEQAAIFAIGVMTVFVGIAIVYVLSYMCLAVIWVYLGLYYVLRYTLRTRHRCGVLRGIRNGVKRYHSKVTPKDIRDAIKGILLGL